MKKKLVRYSDQSTLLCEHLRYPKPQFGVKGRKKKNNPKFPKTNQTFTGIFKGLLS